MAGGGLRPSKVENVLNRPGEVESRGRFRINTQFSSDLEGLQNWLEYQDKKSKTTNLAE